MTQHDDDADRRSALGAAGDIGSRIEGLAQRGKDWLQQNLPNAGPRLLGLLVALVIAGGVARTSYFTVSSDSVAVIQRFGKLKGMKMSSTHAARDVRAANGNH